MSFIIYSLRRLVTGFASAARIAWKLTVTRAIKTATIPAIKNIHDKIAELGYPIGHLKFLLDDGKRQEKISYTSNMQPWAKHKNKRARTDRVVILINARVQTEPALLREIISNAINELESAIGCKFIEGKLSSFKPGYPKPSQRIPKSSSIN